MCYCLGELLNEGRKLSSREKSMFMRYAFFGLFFLAVGTSASSNIAAAFGLAMAQYVYPGVLHANTARLEWNDGGL